MSIQCRTQSNKNMHLGPHNSVMSKPISLRKKTCSLSIIHYHYPLSIIIPFIMSRSLGPWQKGIIMDPGNTRSRHEKKQLQQSTSDDHNHRPTLAATTIVTTTIKTKTTTTTTGRMTPAVAMTWCNSCRLATRCSLEAKRSEFASSSWPRIWQWQSNVTWEQQRKKSETKQGWSQMIKNSFQACCYWESSRFLLKSGTCSSRFNVTVTYLAQAPELCVRANLGQSNSWIGAAVPSNSKLRP